MTLKTKSAANSAKRQAILTGVFLTSSLIIAQLSHAEGLSGQFTFGQSIRHVERSGGTNSQDEGTFSRTDLGLRLSSETRTQKLEFTANTALDYRLSSGGTGDRQTFEDPRATLSYALENKNHALEFVASYQRVNLDETSFLDEDGEIETGAGRRETYGLTSNLTFGRESRTTLNINHSYRQVNYSGTTNPSLVDLTRNNLGARLTFQLSEVAQVYTFANYQETDAARAGTNDRTTTRYGVGGSYDIDDTLSVTGEVSHSKIETDDNAGTTSSRSGVGYSLGATKDLTNGSLTFSFDEEDTVAGKRRQLLVGRDYEFKRGTLAFSVGVSKTDGLSARPIANVNANLELDDSATLSLSLSQTSAVSDDNDVTINSRFGLTYARELTQLSSLSASLQVTDRNALSTGAQDQTSVRLNLSHRYEVGNEWDLVSGVTYSKTRRSTAADISSSVVSIGLQKTFDFRP